MSDDSEMYPGRDRDWDYGWGVRVRRPFGARGMSSVRYGIRLGDLKENWFLCFPIKHSTHTGLLQRAPGPKLASKGRPGLSVC